MNDQSYLKITVEDNGVLESDFCGTTEECLKFIAFTVCLLAKVQKCSHLEILSAARGLLEDGEFVAEMNKSRLN